jgi:enoyl-CoA hydratase/carnithine racemase
MDSAARTDPTRFVLVAERDAVCRVTLNRPETLNALTEPMIDELQAVFEALTSDTETHVVVLEGAGGNFCAGADMSLFLELATQDEAYLLLQRIKRLIETMRAAPQPIICKLEGVAYGGGANLALACDLVIAAESARICQVFSALGLNLDFGGTYVLPRLVGLSRARALALLGEQIDGRAAAEMGMIYRAVPPGSLEYEVTTLATALRKKSPQALTSIKHGLDQSFDMTLSEALEWEATRQAAHLQSPELKAAAQSFIESRRKKGSERA